MIVPGLACSVPELHESYAALEQTARYERLPRVNALAVHLFHALRLVGDVEGVGGFHLHAVGQLEGLDSRFDGAVVRVGALVGCIQPAQQVELRSLCAGGLVIVADVLDQFFDAGVLRVDVGALIDAGQETAAPVFGFLDRVAAGAHGDEAGEVLVFGAQAVGDPGADAGAGHLGVAAVHQHERRLVIRHLRLHRANDAQIVRVPRRLLKQAADLQAAVPVSLEFKRRRHRRPRFALGFQILHRQRLAVVAREHRLGVEGIDVGGTAVEEEVNDALGAGRKVGAARRERVERVDGLTCAGDGGVAQQRGEAERAHAHAAALQQFPAA